MSKVACKGGCHCGAVRFRVHVPRQVEVRRCNCSICEKTGYVHLTVARPDFELLSGNDDLSEYRFNTGTARHLFCRHCGVKSFYVPRSHPNSYSVNLNCVSVPNEIEVRQGEFDGKNCRRRPDGGRKQRQRHSGRCG